MSTVESPYRIAVANEKIQQLKEKLALTVFPDELEDAGWNYGVPLTDLKRLITRWKDGYDWKKHEAELNEELPQFTRDIEVDGHGALNIHYVHKKSEVVDAIPLLFVHGWPGSVMEVRKILPLLIQASPNDPSFHVVTFSLPGYGFSEAPKKKGFALEEFAQVGHKLMLSLGYNEYVTQGGDWGHWITKRIALMYGGKHTKAWHSNMPTASPPQLFHRPLAFLNNFLASYSAEDRESLERSKQFNEKGMGYFMEQSTQPQTIGYLLADSPAGLLAWIYEKLVTWTDKYPWNDDEVLTWVSMYWFSRAGPAASARIYYELNKKGEFVNPNEKHPIIPTGYSYFPQEPVRPPRRWLKTPHLVFERKHSSGGHFAAHEKPEELVGDLRAMFGKGGPAHSAVPGKIGYRF
ncbi:Alpha/Beta hydrolase protein [Cyathus striatus]|nr:Alpha/Beta hydrolase protein [Cyathus striatus]